MLPCALRARLPNGRLLEALLTQQRTAARWQALVKGARRLKAGMPLPFAEGALNATAIERCGEDGEQWLLEFEQPSTLHARLQRHGFAPLPPYIRRLRTQAVSDAHHPHLSVVDAAADPTAAEDRLDYQTLFAQHSGSVAAPTAALHFTPDTLNALKKRGVQLVTLTLHVGAGTFLPLSQNTLAQDQLPPEWLQITSTTSQAILRARKEKRCVVAVGTTCVRALETWAAHQFPSSFQYHSQLFIRPGHRFLATDAIVTNFHLPCSSLLLLVAAFHGGDRLLKAYQEAICQNYRFYSYGDCMLIH